MATSAWTAGRSCWPPHSAPYGPSERWLSVVAPEEPDGVELVLHLADEPARAFQAASRQACRPVLSLHRRLRRGGCSAQGQELERTRVIESPGATHLRFRVVRR